MQEGMMETYTGVIFNPLDPRPEDISILDIAHALSLTCRYSGHCRTFYSVAEHSIRVSRILPLELRLEGLMHDAAEAYLGDMIRPLKRQAVFGDAYRAAEERMMRVIASVFRFQYPIPQSVHDADNVMLVTEKRDIKESGTFWMENASYSPLKSHIEPWSPRQAKEIFLNEFHSLSRQK